MINLLTIYAHFMYINKRFNLSREVVVERTLAKGVVYTQETLLSHTPDVLTQSMCLFYTTEPDLVPLTFYEYEYL